ncbi:MAG: 3-oxoacyl-ACP reductase FabG [Prevotellaceae bacterium]|jgi:3-oxoacyl-[acyl-carrier protein] reductase|nr:3-oxoacyl-ACP reductase FabG [Prevotellaceae bacterium]
MNLNLTNKTVLVTGGSRGIGAAICEGFAQEQANIVINYRKSEAEADLLAEKLRSRHAAKVMTVHADMGNKTEVLEMVAKVEKEMGSIEVLVNNAAVCPSGSITDYTGEDWEQTFAVNVTGMFLVTREVVRRLLHEQRAGAIVNIASQAAFRGSTSGHLPYDSSKGAVIAFTRGLAREVSAKGIRVNAVAPGLALTEMVAKNWAERKEQYLLNIPVKRIAEPEEIADAVLFLASDRASYITGATLDISGGMMMH